MRRRLAGLALAMTIAGGGAIAPAAAQNYLGAYLQAQQYGNLREIQQRNRRTQERRRAVTRSPHAVHGAPRTAPAYAGERRRARTRTAAEDAWRLIQPEYEMRVRRDGRAAAQRWARAKAIDMGRAAGAAERRGR